MRSASAEPPEFPPRDAGPPPEAAGVSEQVEDMAAAWSRGERPRAEEYIARLPDARDEDAVRLIYEEVCLRQDGGEDAVSDEILRRFPRWRNELTLLLECNRALRGPEPIIFPEIGDDLEDFHLLAEIGRGAVGRTYLASQQSLSQRLMVLKITPLGQFEHLSLAKLQHMHIVPLYFEREIPDRSYRVLGMPYLGGASLSKILETLRPTPVSERHGGQIVTAIDRCSVEFSKEENKGPFRTYFANSSYVRAICWIGYCLAEALHYAHERGLVHLDVKPSNVLLAGDGQPMLLDFHLAQSPIEPGKPVPERLGGTPGYTSPEQDATMEAIRRGGRITRTVDGRSDVFSLGLLLYEALGGDAGTGSSSSRRALEQCNASVSPGLSDVVSKALAYNPANRYPDAASFAQDLNHHLNEKPLVGVKNRDLRERYTKWRRRHPAKLSLLLLAIGAALVGLTTLIGGEWYVIQRRREIDRTLQEGTLLYNNLRYREALQVYDRCARIADRFPSMDYRRGELASQRTRVRRALAGGELHDIVERLRAQMGITPLSPEQASRYVQSGRQIWKARDTLTRIDGKPPLSPEFVEQVQTDLLDLATTLAALRFQNEGKPPDRAALLDCIQLLREARDEIRPTPALVRDLLDYEKTLYGAPIESMAIPEVRAPSDSYNLGLSYLRTRDFVPAQQCFQRAIDQKPDDFWSYFSLATCAYRRERYQEALDALNICVALAPATAECYLNRAWVEEALRHPSRALDDYTRALKYNPKLSDAARDRGTLHAREGRLKDAIHDLEYALTTSASRSAQGRIEYRLACIYLGQDDRASAKAYLKTAVRHGDADAKRLQSRLDRD